MSAAASITPLMIVDWNSGELRPAPRKDRPDRRETYFRATCGECHGERWLRKSDAKKDCRCRRCHTSEIGKKGYQTTVERHGSDFALKFVQEYRLTHPSAPERAVSQIIETEKPFDLSIEREYRFDGKQRSYLLDFVIKVRGEVVAGIEVDGWHHQNRPSRQQRDQLLEQEWDRLLLRVRADQINPQQIISFVNQAYCSAAPF